MRKQDRIVREQNRSDQQPRQSQPQQKSQEQMRGSASAEQANRPQRQPGKLPLPE